MTSGPLMFIGNLPIKGRRLHEKYMLLDSIDQDYTQGNLPEGAKARLGKGVKNET